MSSCCLDSWAVLRWLEGVEPAASRVDALLGKRPLMSWINVSEVFYVTIRSVGRQIADDVVSDLRHFADLDAVTPARVLEAGAIKAAYPMALADAFAVATALAHEAVLLTGDPEILDIGGAWMTEDLR